MVPMIFHHLCIAVGFGLFLVIFLKRVSVDFRFSGLSFGRNKYNYLQVFYFKERSFFFNFVQNGDCFTIK